MGKKSENFFSAARRGASRLSDEFEQLKQLNLSNLVELELQKKEAGETITEFEAGLVEKIGLGVASAALFLQALSTGIDFVEYRQKENPSEPMPSCDQIENVIQDEIAIDESIPIKLQNRIIRIASEETVTIFE